MAIGSGGGPSKLVGQLQLDVSQLKSQVDAANNLLKSIGQGVNLNLTQGVNAQLQPILNNFQTQLQNILTQTQNMANKVGEAGNKAGQQAQQNTQRIVQNAQQVSAETAKMASHLTNAEKVLQRFDRAGNQFTTITGTGRRPQDKQRNRYINGDLQDVTVTQQTEYAKAVQLANNSLKEQLAIQRNLNKAQVEKVNTTGDTTTIDERIKGYQQAITLEEKFRSQLDQTAVAEQKNANVMKALRDAEIAGQTKLAEAQRLAAEKEFSGAEYLDKAKRALADLTNAQHQYLDAKKNGNYASMEYWKGEQTNAKASLESVNQSAQQANIAIEAKQKMLALTQQATVAEGNFKRAAGELSTLFKNVGDTIGRTLVFMGMMQLKKIWGDAVSYVKEYYDALNEIRIVTGMSEEDANKLGESYRKLGKEMAVSSREIATASVEFYRQGLNESTVNERVKYATMYAKISALGFKESAELITSATNTYNISAKRVADVWSVLGDESASG